jgi:hypothetical protein
MFVNKHTVHFFKQHNVGYTDNWIRNNEYKEAESNHQLGSTVATAHSKLESQSHTNILFAFKFKVLWLLGQSVIVAQNKWSVTVSGLREECAQTHKSIN